MNETLCCVAMVTSIALIFLGVIFERRRNHRMCDALTILAFVAFALAIALATALNPYPILD